MLRRFAFVIVIVSLIALSSGQLQAQQLFRKFRSDMRQLGRSLVVKKRPVTGTDVEMENLARELDWLEAHINKFGSVVAKQPDVWGESRLTKHRAEYEEQMFKQLEAFEVRDNARIAREDMAFLASATGISAAINGPAPAVEATATASSAAADVGNAPPPTDESGNINPAPINQTIQIGDGVPLQGNRLTATSSLDITEELNQRSRYLNHLHQLRRINSGDDTSDAPGYALNLVRIPVSISPGRETRRSHGAKVTITAKPYLGNSLLPETFENLVINDVVDQLALPVLKLAEDPALPYFCDAVIYQARYRTVLRNIGELSLWLQSTPKEVLSDLTIHSVLESVFQQGNLTLNLGAAKTLAMETIELFKLRIKSDSLSATEKAKIEGQIKQIETTIEQIQVWAAESCNGVLPAVDSATLNETQRRYALAAAFTEAQKASSGANTLSNDSDKRIEIISDLTTNFINLGKGFRDFFRKNQSKLSLNPTARRRRASIPVSSSSVDRRHG